MDFREYEIARDGDEVVVTGTIREPVSWDFTIRISGDDIPGMLRLGLHRQTIAMAVRWVLHRRSHVTPVPEAPPAEERAPRPAVSPRAVAPRPTPMAAPRGPAPRSTSGVKTPDFGAPRRRGDTFGEHAPAADVFAEGERG